jgi:hypothetical protein
MRTPEDVVAEDPSPGARFPIRFERWYGWLSAALGLRPKDSYVEVRDGEVLCKMGWGFHARFPRAVVARVVRLDRQPLSRGVHGFGGRWLVNGAGAPILSIDLMPEQRARVMGVPVRLHQLMVSVDDPDGLSAALKGGG